ncbi:hypothetical protein [Novipirellula galeiformis]|uniref:hypothetical protein n=1 Tax=Novipirellula galeiformis TaxID=2528004 RepID=UPI0018CF20ED|nr:hypothetical protein [Novipirellula galeiformis]
MPRAIVSDGLDAAVICGLRKATEGKILFGSTDVTPLAPAAHQVGYVSQDAGLFPEHANRPPSRI